MTKISADILSAAASVDHAYSLLVEVSGRAMQPDFENVLEREIENLLNEVNGIMHRGPRGVGPRPGGLDRAGARLLCAVACPLKAVRVI